MEFHIRFFDLIGEKQEEVRDQIRNKLKLDTYTMEAIKEKAEEEHNDYINDYGTDCISIKQRIEDILDEEIDSIINSYFDGIINIHKI